MNIKETFLKLTSKTYPHGYEDELVSFLPNDCFIDEYGNYYVQIGNSKTAFACHLDTCCQKQVDVVHVIDDNIIKTDGKSVLGADDKAGMTILLYMIENKIPGLYCFFIGEEVGCIGSSMASNDKWFKSYDKMISFDRRGTNSIITYQSSKRSCSDDFGNELASRLNKYDLSYEIDDSGVYTDSAEFVKVIPECTNISVGYYNEHRFNEYQDIEHLILLANASINIDWETLPVKRNPNTTEYKSYDYDYDEFNRYNYGNVGVRKKEKYKTSWPIDYCFDDYNYRKYNKGKTYYNTLDNEIEIDDFIESELRSPAYYEVLKQIIYDDRITSLEWDKIKEQFLDMSNPSDVEFYHAMKNSLD